VAYSPITGELTIELKYNLHRAPSLPGQKPAAACSTSAPRRRLVSHSCSLRLS
jgi:hypothetical protein